MALVVLLVDEVEIRKYPIGAERLLIGRSSDAQIHVDDTTVSGKHAVLECITAEGGDGEQSFFIQDLNSTNGTRVGGEKVRRKKLSNGDVIKIGWNVFKFINEDESPQFFDPNDDEYGQLMGTHSMRVGAAYDSSTSDSTSTIPSFDR